MHWNNGKFYKDVTVGGVLYTTDHKHIAVFGATDYTQYGELNVNSYMHGKEVGLVANNKFFADSEIGSNLWSKQYIRLEAGSTSANHSSESGSGIEIVSKNGNALFSAENNAVVIKSTGNAVNIDAGTYVNLNASTGITINNASYGTSLPTSGNVEGRLYFKLIS